MSYLCYIEKFKKIIQKRTLVSDDCYKIFMVKSLKI